MKALIKLLKIKNVGGIGKSRKSAHYNHNINRVPEVLQGVLLPELLYIHSLIIS